MFKLNSRMLQQLERDLTTLHGVIRGKRIDGHYMEELITRAINSDFSSGTKAVWKEANHNKDADIVVSCTTGETVLLSIKSGRQTKRGIVISGYRLQGLANGFVLGSLSHLSAVSDFLNGQLSQMIAVPCQTDDSEGRHFVYFVSYLNASFLSCSDTWEKHNSVFRQTNEHGVIIELRPSCSWQVWWTIPASLFETSPSLYI